MGSCKVPVCCCIEHIGWEVGAEFGVLPSMGYFSVRDAEEIVDVWGEKRGFADDSLDVGWVGCGW